MKKEQISIEVGSSIQLQFQRSKMELKNIFKEFIDNSIQSYLTKENKSLLNAINTNICKVKITISEDEIIIEDYAFGMDKEAFSRALRLNQKNKKYPDKSLGEHGMGLKYAAISLGNEYTIESTMLNSQYKYEASISREVLEKDSTSVDLYTYDNELMNTHYTKITIRKLLKKITQKDVGKLVEDLSKIYHKYLENSDLEIFFPPNIKVKYKTPELWINIDGSEYQEDFEGSFIFDDKEYQYFGWIGILNTADTSKEGKAGFSLLKQDRIIISNYRPEYVFGKANSFPYQRIIGEINLNDWDVDFNKSSFSWSNGLEEYFIDHLKNNSVISKMIKIARELRTKDKSNKLTQKKQSKMAKNDRERFSVLKTVKKTVVSKKDEIEDEIFDANNNSNSNVLDITYEGIEYKFFIQYCDDNDKKSDWLRVSTYSDKENKYSIKINNNLPLFKGLKQGESELMQTLSLVVVLSQLSSISEGYKDSYKFVKKMNEIIHFLTR